jgi:adenine-specific DNA-methyltransferase
MLAQACPGGTGPCDNPAMDQRNHRVERLGQVFTRDDVVTQMLALRRNAGRVLEPSAGDGAFSLRLPGCVAIELDASVAPAGAHVTDFFAYPADEQFDTIIGNPPYVRHQDILPATRARLASDLFDLRSNLYLFFIEKCVRHLRPGGELIFIVPRDFIKLTAARRLNAWLFEQGSITDFVETGDARVFGPYVPNCAVFRFEKGRMDRRMRDGRRFHCERGQLMFLRRDYGVPLSALFDVRVGAVSGADDVFVHPDGNMEFVCSSTVDTGLTRRAFFDVRNDWLEQHKTKLLARRVRPFGEHNWWRWGRMHHRSDAPRIYVNGKTRKARPFFLHDCPHYDGAVLALFARSPRLDVAAAAALLNDAVDWQELGFVCDGRFLFTQRSLQTCMLPGDFQALLPASAEC